MSKVKCISIKEDQDRWIVDNCINLSAFVQKRLDEVINKGVI